MSGGSLFDPLLQADAFQGVVRGVASGQTALSLTGLSERAIVLLVFFATANGKLFSRGSPVVYALLLAAILLAFVCVERRFRLQGLLAGPGRWIAGLAGLFVAWVFASALFGEGIGQGLTHWARLLMGALLAWTLAGTAGSRGMRLAVHAWLAGLAASFAVLLVGTLEVGSVFGWAWFPDTRLRLFDLHPGLIAPFFAAGLCLAVAGAASAKSRPLALLGFALMSVLTGLALYHGEARASLLGASVGVVVLVAALFKLVPSRPLPWAAAVLGLLTIGIVGFLSPLGSGVRDGLNDRTFTSSPLGQRYHYWQMAAGSMGRDPMLGHGPRSQWARTELAHSSYLDGDDQGLHAHNLLLAIGEDSGIPAILLFVLLICGVLEIGRRAVLRAPTLAARAWPAGLVAGVLAHLTANQLSMGQTLHTLLPLFLWIALGLLAAELLGDPEEQHKRPAVARVVVAFVLLLVFAVGPVAALWSSERGEAAAAEGHHEQALEHYDRALKFNPLNPRPNVGASRTLLAIGDSEGAIERMKRLVAVEPRLSNWHFTLGSLQLSTGRPADALDSFQRAAELDPFGEGSGDYRAAWAGAHLRLDEVEEARALLLEALRHGSDYWRFLPTSRKAEGTEFIVGQYRNPSGALKLAELLTELGQEVLAHLDAEPPDLFAARRLLGRVVKIHRMEQTWPEALELMESYAQRVPVRYSSTDTMYVRLLCDAGRFDEADEIAAQTLGVRSHVPEQETLRYYRTRLMLEANEEMLARAQDLVPRLVNLNREDLAFNKGMKYELYDFLAELAARRGDVDEALRMHEKALFDSATPDARAQLAARFLAVLARFAPEAPALAAQAARFVEHAAQAPGLVRNEKQLNEVAAVLVGAWPPEAHSAAEAVEAQLEHAGETGEIFLRALR